MSIPLTEMMHSWPQYADELLEDMELPALRSGGSWFTWAFKPMNIHELDTLHEERRANRQKGQRV